jgi:hypothetical protein
LPDDGPQRRFGLVLRCILRDHHATSHTLGGGGFAKQRQYRDDSNA